MVEHSAVNRAVAGSSPALGANFKKCSYKTNSQAKVTERAGASRADI
jgi:hypothetical protein